MSSTILNERHAQKMEEEQTIIERIKEFIENGCQGIRKAVEKFLDEHPDLKKFFANAAVAIKSFIEKAKVFLLKVANGILTGVQFICLGAEGLAVLAGNYIIPGTMIGIKFAQNKIDEKIEDIQFCMA